MTTQSTGSLKGRVAGVLITLIALPILVLAPAFLADRFTMQSPILDNQASIQPSMSSVPDEPVTTTNETLLPSGEGSVVILDDVVDIVRDADQLAIMPDEPDFTGEVVFLDTKSEEGCVLTLRVYSGDSDEDILTGRIRIDDDEIRSPSRDCNLIFLAEPNAQ